MPHTDYTINIKGRLLNLGEARVMGILNATPDSFYSASRSQTEAETARRAAQIVEEGGTIIDIGACSTRPGGEIAGEAEEWERLRMTLAVVRRECPDAVVSVDTFRPEVARMAVEEYGADIINDVIGGSDEMFDMVARLKVPYILCSAKATIHDMLTDLAAKVQRLRDRGAKDIILDPAFGFGKTLSDNFVVLSQMEKLHALALPLLVGVSRKRMVYETLGCTPDEALNGTTVLNTVVMMKGASILRVHDVKAAADSIRLLNSITKTSRLKS